MDKLVLAAADCVRSLGWSNNNAEFVKTRASAEEILEVERERRLRMLMDRYYLDTDKAVDLYLLLIEICNEFVPGFNPLSAKRGRPRNPDRHIAANPMLVLEVHEIRKNASCTILGACKKLSKNKNSSFYRMNPQTLETRYHEQMVNYDQQNDCIRCPSCDARYGRNFERLGSESDVEQDPPADK